MRRKPLQMNYYKFPPSLGKLLHSLWMMSLWTLNYLCSCEKVFPLYTPCTSYCSTSREFLSSDWAPSKLICGLCGEPIIANTQIVSSVSLCVYLFWAWLNISTGEMGKFFFPVTASVPWILPHLIDFTPVEYFIEVRTDECAFFKKRICQNNRSLHTPTYEIKPVL